MERKFMGYFKEFAVYRRPTTILGSDTVLEAHYNDTVRYAIACLWGDEDSRKKAGKKLRAWCKKNRQF
jgi:hypothetical protein